MGVTSWVGFCRVVRGETFKLRELDYVQAARALGASELRVILRHILPNLMHLVVITFVLLFSGLVLSEAIRARSHHLVEPLRGLGSALRPDPGRQSRGRRRPRRAGSAHASGAPVSEPVLRVRDLVTTFPLPGGPAAVVDGVSLEIAEGEVLALVGESGCGKSMTAFSILRLVPKPGRVTGGTVELCGRDVLSLSVNEMRSVRGSAAAMIFQEPMTSLNPVQTVGAQLVEAIRLHESISTGAARRRTVELFEQVGIPDPDQRVDVYPHQLSGGLKQRVMIAMALSLRPRLLIADEPTTALDVTIQAQILELMRDLQRQLGTAILLITHDLGVVNELSDRIAVMYAGQIAEEGTRQEVLGAARHPYTQGLLRSIPSLARHGEPLAEIEGVVPSAGEWPTGCRFQARCARAAPACRALPGAETRLSATRRAFCHAVAEEEAG
jgi:oligopeptide/dipeptide ABC transporter ATP-binding protein